MADVVLFPDGKTSDGKPLFRVVQACPEPRETLPQVSCDKDINCNNMVMDEFGVLRPKRSFLFDFYGSVANLMRRR